MTITLWIVQVRLALTFLTSGSIKPARPRLALDAQMPYVQDFSDGQIKGSGALEVLAAIGLVVPPLLHIATFLTPLAAVGLILLMLGAIATHLRRREPQIGAVNGGLLILSPLVAARRLRPYPLCWEASRRQAAH